MAKQLIIAQFHDYGAAHRAFCELLQSGVGAADMTLLAGDRSNREGASRDIGLLAEDAEHYLAMVHRGISVLAVQADGLQGPRIAEIIQDHAPSELGDEESVTMSGAPADRPPSPGEFGEAETGSVIEHDADLVDAVDPQNSAARPRR